MRWSRVVACVACGVVFAGSGCLSLGWGMGIATQKLDARTAGSNLERMGQVDAFTTYQQLRIVDTSGLLLAAVVSSSRQAEARGQAMDAAAARGAKAGDTVEYSYKPMDILPGVRTTLDLRFALGPGSTTFAVNGATFPKAGYWAFDMGADPIAHAFIPDRLVGSFGFNAIMENWSLENAGVGYDRSDMTIDVYATGKLGYRVLDQLSVLGKLHFGIVSPILGLLVGGPGSPGISVYSGVTALWEPNPFFQLAGDLEGGLPMWADLPVRGGISTRLGVTAVVNLEAILSLGRK